MSRKSRSGIVLDNMGGQTEATATEAADAIATADGTERNLEHLSMVMLERIVKRMLDEEVTRLSEDEAALRSFLTQFFGSVIDVEELETWVENFMTDAPTVSLGYPRSTSHFPGMYIVLTGDEESTKFVGNHVGTKLGNAIGDDADYVGSVFSQTISIYIYAQNPDALGYLYHTGMAILLGGSAAFDANGAMDLHLSGGELAPEEAYLPIDLFCRVIRLSLSSVRSVERLKRQPRAERVRVVGVHASDIMLDGGRGGVHHSPDACE